MCLGRRGTAVPGGGGTAQRAAPRHAAEAPRVAQTPASGGGRDSRAMATLSPGFLPRAQRRFPCAQHRRLRSGPPCGSQAGRGKPGAPLHPQSGQPGGGGPAAGGRPRRGVPQQGPPVADGPNAPVKRGLRAAAATSGRVPPRGAVCPPAPQGHSSAPRRPGPTHAAGGLQEGIGGGGRGAAGTNAEPRPPRALPPVPGAGGTAGPCARFPGGPRSRLPEARRVPGGPVPAAGGAAPRSPPPPSSPHPGPRAPRGR